MTIFRGVRTWLDRFDRAQALTTTPGHNGWTVKDTSSSGTPTYLTTADGLVLTLAATSEAEVVTAYQNDVLPFLLNKIKRVDITLEVAGIDAVTTLVAGLASAQDDTADDIAVNLWARMEGSASTSAIVVESDDGTNDNNDVSTAKTLSNTLKRVTIDFEAGLSDVKFFIDGARVAATTTFNLSNASATQGVQPFIQLQKASGTGTPSVTIREFCIDYNYADGT